jgi:hypothetical protein
LDEKVEKGVYGMSARGLQQRFAKERDNETVLQERGNEYPQKENRPYDRHGK